MKHAQFVAMPRLDRITRVVADIAAERATRRANTLPMLAQFAGTALAAEVQLLAGEHDRVLAAAGVSCRSVLHSVAAHVPDATARAAQFVIEIERGAAALLQLMADQIATAPDTSTPVVE